MTDQVVFDRLAKLTTTHICDAFPTVKLFDSAIKPMFSGITIMGRAFTVNCDGDVLPIIHAIEAAEKSAVIIVEAYASERAVLGEIFSTAAQNKGIAGVIIDGFCRDVAEIKKISFPIFARGVCSKAGTKSKKGHFQIPVSCGGVTVHPDDIIFADENGIVAINSAGVEDILMRAEQIKKFEENAIAALQQGKKLSEIIRMVEA